MAVEKLKNAKNLVVIEAVPHKVLVDGIAVSVGDCLWGCGHDGLRCCMVIQTDKKKRECVLYNVATNQRDVVTESVLNRRVGDRYWGGEDARFWSHSDREAIRRYAEHVRTVAHQEMAGAEERVREASKSLASLKNKLTKWRSTSENAGKAVPALTRAFNKLKEAIKE